MANGTTALNKLKKLPIIGAATGLPGSTAVPGSPGGAMGMGYAAGGIIPTGSMLPGMLPQYGLLNQTAQNLSGALRGELPQDVTNLLQQQAAEYGIASGLPGSQFAGYQGLRNLGLTSLDRMRGAEQLLANQFVSPLQAMEFQQQGRFEQQRLDLEAKRLRQQGKFEEARLAEEKAARLAEEQLARDRLSLQEQAQNFNLGLNEPQGVDPNVDWFTDWTGSRIFASGGYDL